MRNRLSLMVGVLTALTASAAGAQSDPLGVLLGKIIKPSAGQPFGMPSYLAKPKREQVESMKTLVSSKFNQSDVTELTPLVTKVLALAACAQVSQAWDQTNRDRLTPHNFQPYESYAPMQGMQYHDKGYCLDVVRLSEIRKVAANAVMVKAFYVSPLSQQAADQTYAFQKTPDGVWLIKDLSAVGGSLAF